MKNSIKRTAALFVAMLTIACASCEGKPEPAEATESGQTVYNKGEKYVDIERATKGGSGFISYNEAINVDGRCYRKLIANVNFEPWGNWRELESIDASLTKENFERAEYLGSGCCVVGNVAFNDFRATEATEYKESVPAEWYAINAEYVLAKRQREIAFYSQLNPAIEDYGYDDGYEVSEYAVFVYDERSTIISDIAGLLYNDMTGENTLGIINIRLVSDNDSDVTYLEAEINAPESEKLSAFIREKSDGYNDIARIITVAAE